MEPNKIGEAQRLTVDERGNWQYPTAASSGHIEVAATLSTRKP